MYWPYGLINQHQNHVQCLTKIKEDKLKEKWQNEYSFHIQ